MPKGPSPSFQSTPTVSDHCQCIVVGGFSAPNDLLFDGVDMWVTDQVANALRRTDDGDVSRSVERGIGCEQQVPVAHRVVDTFSMHCLEVAGRLFEVTRATGECRKGEDGL